jgi:hypothetical protein
MVRVFEGRFSYKALKFLQTCQLSAFKKTLELAHDDRVDNLLLSWFSKDSFVADGHLFVAST